MSDILSIKKESMKNKKRKYAKDFIRFSQRYVINQLFEDNCAEYSTPRFPINMLSFLDDNGWLNMDKIKLDLPDERIKEIMREHITYGARNGGKDEQISEARVNPRPRKFYVS